MLWIRILCGSRTFLRWLDQELCLTFFTFILKGGGGGPVQYIVYNFSYFKKVVTSYFFGETCCYPGESTGRVSGMEPESKLF
jgi:hypothetical protein